MTESRDRTEPTAGELARLVPPLDPRHLAATAPTEAEVERLTLRRRAAVPAPTGARVLGVAVAALAAGLLLALRAVPDPDILAVPVGQVIDVVDVQKLDATWSIRGEARVRVARAASGALEVEVDRGRLAFEADGAASPLRVHAHDTLLGAESGRFSLRVGPDRVDLGVLAGVVQLLGPEVRAVVAGSGWTWPPLIARTDPPRVAADPPRGLPPAAPSRVAPTPTPSPAAAPPPDPSVLAAALLSRREAGDSAAALAPLVDDWVGRYPESPLAAEMRWLQLELAVDTTAPSLALGLVDRWITAHPGDPRRVDAWWLRAEVAESRLHDCAAAAVAYRWLVEHAGPGDAREAARRLDACGPVRDP